ncbi:MAG: GTPase ObgE [Firmicutes bacterium]|nr:GTPase ObgE [Bacillota bacterium]
MFLDKVTITVKAGNGGGGHISFFRDKLSASGPPDGGDGGRGGDIIFVGTTREDNLVNFRYTKKFRAEDGEPGGTRNKFGKSGQHMRITVPLGTRIYTADTRELIADITEPDQEFVALRGGAGGRGNKFFATARKRTPNFSQMGVETKEHMVRLELNTIADIGLVGFPNVGKSTLLSALTRANPKIANYHFTTLHPNIGVAQMHDQNIVIADVPGLIEGASEGTGLGHDFLKHLRRTRLLVHVLDISQQEGRGAIEDFDTINRELREYDMKLAGKPQIVVLNKIDVADADVVKKTEAKLKKRGFAVFKISAAINDGTNELLTHAAIVLRDIPRSAPAVPTAVLEAAVDKNAFEVGIFEGEYYVTGPLIDNLIRGVVLSDSESNAYFQRRLIQSGIIDALKAAGMGNGDTVHIAEIEFEWND